MLRRLRHLRTLPLAFLIVLLGFQVSPALRGLNLCIGINGHVEIESEDADCCPSETPLANDRALAEEEGTCTSCIDVCLGGDVANTLAGPATQSLVVFFPAPSVLERLKPIQSSSIAQDLGLPIKPALMAIRSVVLRV